MLETKRGASFGPAARSAASSSLNVLSRHVVLADNLSSKWKEQETGIAENQGAVVKHCGSEPAKILEILRRLEPCTLVIPFALLERFPRDEFIAATDLGRAIQVLVEFDELTVRQAEFLARMGCSGFIPSSASASVGWRALRKILDGELWLSRKMSAALIRQLLREKCQGLTPRESDVLALLRQHCKNAEIAERLHVTVETVRWHLRSLYKKAGTRERSKLADSGWPLPIDPIE